MSVLFIQKINNTIKFKRTIYCGLQNKQPGLILHTCRSRCPCGALQTGRVLRGPEPFRWWPWRDRCSRPECRFPLSRPAGGTGLWVLTEENQHHEGSGVWILCALDGSKRAASSGRLLRSTRSVSTESSAVPDSRGRSGGSDPERRSLRSPGWAESSPCQP